MAARPSGPRPQRTPSPAPFALQNTQPLNIAPRKNPPALSLLVPGALSSSPNGRRFLAPIQTSTPPPPPPPLPIHVPARPQEPPSIPIIHTPPSSSSNSLPSLRPDVGIYNPSRSKGGPRGPALKINPIVVGQSNAQRSNDSDSPTYSYWGGPTPLAQPNRFDGVEQPTIRPEDTTVAAPHGGVSGLTIRTVRSPPPAIDTRVESTAGLDSLDSVRHALTEIAAEEVRVDAPIGLAPGEEWSDDMFEELARLGEGAGGAVYKVREKRSGILMARKSITTHSTVPKQLVRELQFMKSTVHVNICRFYGAYISPSSSEVKVLMELCEGGSLEAVGKRIKELNRHVSEKVVGRLAEGIFSGLAYLHAKRIIHRDIKPSNILLTKEGVVRLCDFGVSGELIDSLVGTFTGTSFYMAPERISGQRYSIRADVWSTGLTLLELATNKFPFPPDIGPIDLIFYITQSDPPSLEDEGDMQWSDSMKHFIKLTLTVSATDRPAPREMLGHPWIVENMRKEVKMAQWVREVWGWPKPSRKRNGYSTHAIELEQTKRIRERGRIAESVNGITPSHGQLKVRAPAQRVPRHVGAGAEASTVVPSRSVAVVTAASNASVVNGRDTRAQARMTSLRRLELPARG